MIHQKITSPSHTPQRKKRQSLNGSAKTKQQDIETELEEPVPVRYSDLYKQKKAQAEMGNMFKKKKTYPIAPDGLIPNSTLRTVFKRKIIKPAAIKAFQLRLDILENLQNKNNNLNRQNDDEEWAELDDPDLAPKTTSGKKSKGTLGSRQKNTTPDLFKRMQNESWWKQTKEEKLDIKSMLVYLMEILKLKQIDSYESACYYTIEIFRTYGIEPIFVNQILDILLSHLTKNGNDRLDICTIRTIGQFMFEKKDIIIHLLESALKYQSNDTFRLELVNTIKFITDVNNSDDIDLVLENMSVVYDYPDESFSLKMIIKGLENKKKIVVSEVVKEEEEKEEIHPLLKKISEERWFPRGNSPITLDFVLDAIISKLPNSTKTTVKTLTTHFIQLHHIIGYSKEQFDRVSNGLISLLSHSDADYRLIAATNLANLNKETKNIDIALLNSFINDPRILVRTECCDTLKKLTGIMSDTVLKDCADDISYLQTLSEENFSLQNYLKEKNRLPTLPPPPPLSVEEPVILPVEEKFDDEGEQNLITDQIETTEDIIPIIPSRSPSPQIIEQPSIIDPFPQPEPLNVSSSPTSIQPSTIIPFPEPPNISSSQTPIQPSISVEMNEKRDSHIPRSRKERTSIEITRQNKQSISPTKTPIPDQIPIKRSSLLPNNTNLWDSYVKQTELTQQKDNDESQLDYCPAPQSTLVNQEQNNDPIQKIIEEHKQTIGFYRMTPNRHVLIPHKISMENILSDQSHIIMNHDSSQLPIYPTNLMNLSDLNHNQHQLNEVEFIQLLSSLVIRAVQVHRQYEKFVPGFNFTNVLNVSQMPLHSSTNINSSLKLPLILPHRPTTRQFARMQSHIQAKAAREGINIHKARSIEGALSNLLKPNREQTKSTMVSSLTSHFSPSRQIDTTHGWLLVQLLKSQGIFNSENYLEKIIQTYPKFILLLNTKIPQNLISIICNDPIMKQIASIFSDKRDLSSLANSSMKRSDTKPSILTTDDEYLSNGYDYTALMNRNDRKKKFLPAIRGSKMNLPRHVLKFGFREIETDSSESSNNSSREENKLRSRKRRVYMHILMSANENIFNRHETVKNQLGHMINTDYQGTSFMPIVTRPPMCQ